MSQERAIKVQNALTFVSLLFAVACFEYRVVFRAFGHLIALFPPWNYIFVTVTLYSLFGFVGALLMGYTMCETYLDKNDFCVEKFPRQPCGQSH
jgi:hypothetical protein